MKEILSVTSRAVEQIKKIISSAPGDVEGIVVGVDKSGCSGYSYKLDYAKIPEVKNFDLKDYSALQRKSFKIIPNLNRIV